MSAPIDHNVPHPNLDDVDVPVEPNLDEYVRTADFDNECHKKARILANSSSEEGSSSGDDLCPSDDSVSSATTSSSCPYDVSKLEALLYYAGLGPKGHGPKLIYRTSDDVFEAPSGPEAYNRLMRIVAVPDTFEFGTDVTWDKVRDQVVMLLDRRNIKVTLVDFVRFTWLKKPVDREIDDDDDDDDAKEEEELNYDDIPRIQTVEYGDRHYTNPTIWIGVLPDTLTGSVAHESSLDIRAYLDSLHIQNVDIAYRVSRRANTKPNQRPVMRSR
ncbi:hypothetical protein CC1G_10019 [Coprinopsis cinerea okayama7|uniref:Uncharacterized protein n=1 Tax=Coprinopsis cinerea (strain Okayama-7 / 130 / ATCC MYA-4618 / FGSC 9003) TaxID=240176 RepID=A8NDL9_COPC7|nr:hypothetical protein CC1G_10019 [Coprinopsis cinerea okayama7\|eukprot:XP_001832805.1 hypothetical protein CC1G_10019 [Coprinopsis cinerea okayama7\